MPKERNNIMETLTIRELRTRATEYGNRLNHCASNKEHFDITLKILDSIYVELIQALKEEGERLEEEIEEME
jgi:hypothetical protein|tara:strand:+ start:542 stop:757 length:216 start_codon:yes stop_codon:yes gene_type:complete